MSTHVIWEAANVDHACVLARLTNVEEQYRFSEGVSLIAGWPENATYTQNLDYPDNTILTDSLSNVDSLLVASRSLKNFLQRWDIPHVEYLRVNILDHKQRILNEEYHIVHALNPVDCLKMDERGVTWNPVDKKSIMYLDRFVIDESRIDKKRYLFRPKLYSQALLAHRELTVAITAKKFTGIRWVEMENYPEI